MLFTQNAINPPSRIIHNTHPDPMKVIPERAILNTNAILALFRFPFADNVSNSPQAMDANNIIRYVNTPELYDKPNVLTKKSSTCPPTFVNPGITPYISTTIKPKDPAKANNIPLKLGLSTFLK